MTNLELTKREYDFLTTLLKLEVTMTESGVMVFGFDGDARTQNRIVVGLLTKLGVEA